ncbi:uncharacterized protein GGS22DRAFT_5268 [Annulohypoxylon maeteangense]|uniref:uncharacterized protein n=1 Tax=Annulohypoxylon maeteangense TaxID=1927788 RepID=UPI0020076E21|nr:uncharacterized protein GGS22DRAFT_5268 [Annulohypoxylon maeteangense]KAI0889870.1 hypothetical protein GGS22DRAFT_5268 [Annulohypoxylon maeteangense]
MAPPISNTSAEPTLYDILALTPKHLEGQAGAVQQQKIVKQAYHRALLKHHPDKSASGPSTSTSPPSSSTTSPSSKPAPKPHAKQAGSHTQPRITYTVDQIQHAHTILSDAQKRREYDRELRASPSQRATQSFQTGVETVDLDDVSFDERGGVYYRSCRCGNERGYAFTEENLEEFEEDGVLMVECLDCSLWIRVLFAAAEDEEVVDVAVVANPGGSSRGPNDEAVAAREGDAVMASGEQRGTGTGRGFTFNWSFNWGISLSGTSASSSATIDTGSGSQR